MAAGKTLKKSAGRLVKNAVRKALSPVSKRQVRGSGPKVASKTVERDTSLERRRMEQVLSILRREYPEARCSLDYENPFQLLIATILSAQCTDERVNLTTPELFRRYPDAKAMAKAKLSDLEKLVQPTGFFRMKALSLQEASRSLIENHGGELPRTVEELVKLRGVGRKTANVVLGNAFGISSGVVVDTHVGRLSRRLGFTQHQDPVKVELDLQEVVPQKDWTDFAHLMIAHGRAICTARKAYCFECPVNRLCPKVGVSPSERGPSEER